MFHYIYQVAFSSCSSVLFGLSYCTLSSLYSLFSSVYFICFSFHGDHHQLFLPPSFFFKYFSPWANFLPYRINSNCVSRPWQNSWSSLLYFEFFFCTSSWWSQLIVSCWPDFISGSSYNTNYAPLADPVLFSGTEVKLFRTCTQPPFTQLTTPTNFHMYITYSCQQLKKFSFLRLIKVTTSQNWKEKALRCSRLAGKYFYGLVLIALTLLL